MLGDLDSDTRQLVQEIDNLTKLADYSTVNYSNQPSSIFAPQKGQPVDANLAVRIPGQTVRDAEWKKLINDPMPLYQAPGEAVPTIVSVMPAPA